MKYKVGDKVRIKNCEIDVRYYMENGVSDVFTSEMSEFISEIVTISEIIEGKYRIREHAWNWTDGMLESISKEEMIAYKKTLPPNEDKVKSYLKGLYNNLPINTNALHFSTERKLEPKSSLEEIIEKILEFSYYDYSINENNNIETTNQRWRSSLDIWRHVKYFKPEITIFDVMRGLYKLRGDLSSRYCSTVERRVFKLQRCTEYKFENMNMKDEYGLIFSDWENIGLEEEK